MREIEFIQTRIVVSAFTEFEQDQLRLRAAQRSIEIISEAVRHFEKAAPGATSSFPDIPWRQIMDIGNRLRHEYHATSAQLLWFVMVDDLPPLHAAVADLAERFSSQDTGPS
ncbi:MAG: HepT-like ribonuclease domain-containing protein [Pseudomonadota bacterium]